MLRRPPRSTRTDTLFPYTTLFRSALVMVFGRGADAGYEGAVGARHHHQRPVGLEVVGQRHRDAERAHAWHAVLDVPGLELGLPVEFLGAEARLVVQARLADRSEELSVGKACVSTCRVRGETEQ